MEIAMAKSRMSGPPMNLFLSCHSLGWVWGSSAVSPGSIMGMGYQHMCAAKPLKPRVITVITEHKSDSVWTLGMFKWSSCGMTV